MSQTTTTVVPAPPLTDRTATIAKLAISAFALCIFVVALSIAWWTHDPSLPLLLGMAGTNATAVISYWIGSSAGSATKDATMAQIGKASTTVTETKRLP